ncbi:hypothetical protein ACNAN0_06435 [Agrilactobacillus fermenti]|uniref:hypothetical protein n=1 Tax=Agrilactobacillus fermenti TaxID=2586909 RepID=UPI003A5C5341
MSHKAIIQHSLTERQFHYIQIKAIIIHYQNHTCKEINEFPLNQNVLSEIKWHRFSLEFTHQEAMVSFSPEYHLKAVI